LNCKEKNVLIKNIFKTYDQRFREAEAAGYVEESTSSDYLVSLLKKIKKVRTLPVLHKSNSYNNNLYSSFPGAAAGCLEVSLMAKWRVTNGFTESEVDVIHKDIMGRAAPLLQIRSHIAKFKNLDILNKLSVYFEHKIHRFDQTFSIFF